jgi:hypothetical protein
VISKRKWLAFVDPPGTGLPAELGAFQTIEVCQTDPSYTACTSEYFAVWHQASELQNYGPKAIRILVRLYDSQKRLADARGNPGQLYTMYFDLP